MQIIRIPSIAENATEATVGHWMVSEGDTVIPGQELVEIITEKATFAVEAEAPGKVSACLAPEKSVLPVGAIICLIDATVEEIEDARQENETKIHDHLKSSTVKMAVAIEPDRETPAVPRPAAAKVRATPSARRLAKEAGINLEDVAAMFGDATVIKDKHIEEYRSKQ